MTEIFISNLKQHPGSIQEIRYLNYLVFETFDEFKELIAPNKYKAYVEDFIETCVENYLIIIPKGLEIDRLTTSEKRILKNPKKFIKSLEYFKKWFYIFSIKDGNLTDLDQRLTGPFLAKSVKNVQDEVVVLNDYTRLNHYQDIVYGIGSEKFKYIATGNLFNYMKDKLCKLQKIDPELRNLVIYYTVGTTAISTKGFNLK